jgi:hypothetical protein
VFKAYMDKVKVVTREEADRCSVEKLFDTWQASRLENAETDRQVTLHGRDYKKLFAARLQCGAMAICLCGVGVWDSYSSARPKSRGRSRSGRGR